MSNNTLEKEIEITSKEETVISLLKEIQGVYKNVFHLSMETRERMILKGLYVLSSKKAGFEELVKAIEEINAEYPGDSFPHDDSLMCILRRKLPNYGDIPTHAFDQIMVVYKWADMSISGLFSKIEPLLTEEQDRHIINRLHSGVHCTLVDNPNFKASKEYGEPYYKRNFWDFNRSCKLSEELLDQDFNDWIKYFEEVLQGEE